MWRSVAFVFQGDYVFVQNHKSKEDSSMWNLSGVTSVVHCVQDVPVAQDASV